MADAAESLILQALARAATAPDGLPLLAARSLPGLFANQAAAKLAAQTCKDRGFLQLVRSEKKGRATVEYCTLSERGWAFLLEQSSPRPVLEALLAAMQDSQARTADLTAATHRHQQTLDAIRAAAERLQGHLARQAAPPEAPPNGRPANGDVGPEDLIRSCLDAWNNQNSLGDCPLPELFRRVQARSSRLTIGLFHDALRHLADKRVVHLHPWTGPLYELPEPSFALLVGHEIAYYASLAH